MDDRKWAKVPLIPADAFILDLEDAVAPQDKELARDRVVEYLSKPEYFNGAMIVPRSNGLDTQWGRDDLIAFAEAGAKTVMYPKVDDVEDVEAVVELCESHGTSPELVASIESAKGVLNAERIFAHGNVVASTFGPGDLHVDARMSLYEPDGSLNPGFVYPKVRTILAGVAHGVAVLGIAFAPNIKDLDEIRRRVQGERRLGFTGACAFYPPHVAIINETFSPSEANVAHATTVVTAYEAAVAEGKPAVQLEDGETLLLHQYKEAQAILSRVGGSAAGDGEANRS